VSSTAKDTTRVRNYVTELEEALKTLRDPVRPQPGWRERRSEETRQSIMQTTVRCLVSQGYANTTTQIVADSLGLSRGAMVHHYSTRIDMVSATIDFIFLRMLELVYAGVEELAQRGTITHAESGALHWSVLCSDEYLAYIELNIAARTDEELRQSFDLKAIAFDQLWLDRALELLPHWKGNRDGARLAWNFGRAMLEGLKINERIVTSERDRQAIRQKLIAAMTLMEKGDL
jgi:AcrR family transcriptional regulator